MAFDAYRSYYPLELAITVAGTAVSDTFDVNVDIINLVPTIDVWVHPTDTTTAGDGSVGKRLFCKANERRTIPWHDNDIEVVNVTVAETGTVYVDGWLVSS
jgi:hypothetical protein